MTAAYTIPKFCRDCKWCHKEWVFMCHHPVNVDIVKGNPRPLNCDSMREFRCGTGAELFEEIPADQASICAS